MRNLQPFRRSLLAAALGTMVCVAHPPSALSQTPASTPSPAVQTLLDKAHALELHGRTDLATLTWQQVLLVDPTNAEALAGMARASSGGRLAQPDPTRLPLSPSPARNSSTQQGRRAQLDQAAGLAAVGQYTQAIGLYRLVYASASPPPGEEALAFYETEAATEDGRPHATAALRTLAARYPADPRYRVALGRTLTYSPTTRPEGRRLLERYPNDPEAVEALRQSLLWDAQNSTSAEALRAFLALHPDPQLTQSLQPASPPPRPAAEPTRSSDEQTAYHDLHIGRIGEAEQLFKAILERHPSNAAALAGMGYVRIQQGNFGGAISFLTQARQDGSEDPNLDPALNTARFWYTIGAAQAALGEIDLATAEKQYRTALAMRPTSPEALDGLGGTLLKARQPEAAAQLYQRFTLAQPNAPSAWRGLFLAQFASANAAAALATDRRIPSAIHAQLMRDPQFLEALASAYTATGQDTEAQRVLQAALDLPFPTGAQGAQSETQLQYARLLQQANRFDQAESLYRQILAAGPADTAAWVGLIRVQHAAGHDAQAAETLENIPPAVYAAATRDAGFDATVAALFQAQGKLDTAQDVLEKSLAQQAADGEVASVPLQIQLAGIYLQRNRPQLAYPVYQRILGERPDRLDAWMGLLSALHTSGRDQDALAQLQQLPPTVRLQLEGDPAYLHTVAAIYRSLGQPAQASLFLARIQQIYTLRHGTPPADLELEDASLLLASGDDLALYPQLLALGSRTDLTEQQRQTLESQWGSWALRQASQAAAAGDSQRALAILNTAAAAFPDNRPVLDNLAAGFALAGDPRRAVALFQKQDMAHAALPDYLAAVTAATAASDRRDAETWLRQGLGAFPHDPQLLLLAARTAQSRGDSHRAADLYRASLAAMPADSASQTHPVQTRPGLAADNHSPNQVQPQDLAALLAPAAASTPAAGSAANPGSLGTAPIPLPAGGSHPPDPPLTPPTRPSDLAPTSTNRIPSNLATQPHLRNASTVTPPPAPQPFHRSPLPAPGRPPAETIYGPYVPYTPATVSPAAASPPATSPTPPSIRDANLALLRNQTDPRTGQSHPPGDDLPIVPQTTPFIPQSTSADSRQIPRPSTPPSPQPGDSEAQQYPQPRRSKPRTRAPRRASTPPAAIPTPAPSPSPTVATTPTGPSPIPTPQQPQLPGMSYPSFSQQITTRPSYPPTVASLTLHAPPRGIPPPPSRLTPREQAERELASLEATYTGSLAATGMARFRAGAPGLDRLTDLEAPIELSAVLARNLRLAILPRPVFLNSGTLDTAFFQRSAGPIPILGTLPANASTTAAQQIANGLGGEAQLVTANLGLALGYTPYEFLVHNLTARLRFQPAAGPLTLFAERQPIKQTQLSYAGLRDPGSASGSIWGGAVATGAGLRLDLGPPQSRLSLSAHGATLTGSHVLGNTTFDATAAGRFRLASWPRVGTLALGGALYAAHFAHNERGLTFGQGGYFSPNTLFRASVPISLSAHVGRDLHLRLSAAPGFQTFQEAAALFYPLDPNLQAAAFVPCFAAAIAARTCGFFPVAGQTGASYAIDASGAYRVAGHWYFGAFLSADNTNFYNTLAGGFFLRFLFTPQVPLDDGPTGLFPIDGLLPLRVP